MFLLIFPKASKEQARERAFSRPRGRRGAAPPPPPFLSGLYSPSPLRLLDGQEELELGGELVLRVEPVAEVHLGRIRRGRKKTRSYVRRGCEETCAEGPKIFDHTQAQIVQCPIKAEDNPDTQT